MLSKNKIRFISSLKTKKARDEENLYVIEGDKLVREFLNAGIRFKILAAKAEFLDSLPPDKLKLADDAESVSFEELRQMSSLKTPHNALAVLPMNKPSLNYDEIFRKRIVALDCIQDPGNLGTIIRAAAWFGINTIVCSPDSVDMFNPKVIQSTMGAILHVDVHYAELIYFLKIAKEKEVPVYGTFLEGKPLKNITRRENGVILFGNESKGISADLKQYITEKIFIPAGGRSKPGIDSLNVGMAAAVTLYEFSAGSSH